MPSFLINVGGEEDIKTWFDRQNAEWKALNLFIFGAWDKVTGVYVGEMLSSASSEKRWHACRYALVWTSSFRMAEHAKSMKNVMNDGGNIQV